MRTAKYLIIIVTLSITGSRLSGQELDPKGSVQNGATNRANSRMDQGVDKGQIDLKPAVLQLQSFYLSMDVENNWLSGQHVNWETGQPDMPGSAHGNKTHCSAFAAAICQKEGIYLLRPPEHGQVLLANAQFDWLHTAAAAKAGWRRLGGSDRYLQAQTLANDGKIVLCIYKNSDPKVPGHAALVMPRARSMKLLADEGPELIMAGTHNHNYISLRNGFQSHITGWPEQEIQFFVNDLPVHINPV